jgi:Tol biopolymer transport system component
MREAVPLSFSRDGERLLVGSNLPGTQQLYVLPARGGELEQLTRGDEPVTGAFLPDGRILVEVDDGGNERTQLYVPDGSSSRLVADPRHPWDTAPAGRFIAYFDERRMASTLDVVARDLDRRRAWWVSVDTAAPKPSPDGRWVA